MLSTSELWVLNACAYSAMHGLAVARKTLRLGDAAAVKGYQNFAYGSNSPDNRPVCLQPSAAGANYVELRIYIYLFIYLFFHFLYLELIGGIRTICLYGDVLWPAYSYWRLSHSSLCR